MATDVKNPSQAGPAALVGGIIDDVQELIKQQMSLFKAEIKQDIDKAKSGAPIVGAGAALSTVGIVLLALALVYGLYDAFGPLHHGPLELWACYLIVGGAFFVIGSTMIYMVMQRVKSLNPLSETTAGLEENVEWKTKTPK